MFSRVSVFVAIVVAVAASARMERHIHIRYNSTRPSSQCNTGRISCCNSAYNSTSFASFLDKLSVPYDESDMVGINCTPFNVYGAGQAAACQQQPMCCSGNTYEGFMNVGCSPLDFN